MNHVLIVLIRMYRRWVSPWLGPCCRFEPSCSLYWIEALQRHGFWRGAAMGLWRLLKCQPFHPGGLDPVPPAPGARRR